MLEEGLSLIEMVRHRYGPKRTLPSRKNSVRGPVPCEGRFSILDVRVDSSSMDLVFLTIDSARAGLFNSRRVAHNRADNNDGTSQLSFGDEASVEEKEA